MSESDLLDPTVTIAAETSLVDPDSCRFVVNRVVHPGGPYFFDAVERSGGSPLVDTIFGLAGVTYVIVADSVVTVGKAADVEWSTLKAAVGAAIRQQLLTGYPAIVEEPKDLHGRERTDDEIRAAVQELLDKEVNRSIATHGGQILIVDLKDKILSVSMGGGCQGCAASTITLRQGLEVSVRRVAPEVVQILDVTDHASGTKPFYAQGNAPGI